MTWYLVANQPNDDDLAAVYEVFLVPEDFATTGYYGYL